jgi:hypothetical protein
LLPITSEIFNVDALTETKLASGIRNNTGAGYMRLPRRAVVFLFSVLVIAALMFADIAESEAIGKSPFYAFAVVFTGLASAKLMGFMRRLRAPFDEEG